MLRVKHVMVLAVASVAVNAGAASALSCPLGYTRHAEVLSTGYSTAVAPTYGAPDGRWFVQWFTGNQVPLPLYVVRPVPAWMAPPPGSAWIAPRGAGTGDQSNDVSDGTIRYFTAFALPTDAVNARIYIMFAVDNGVTVALDNETVLGSYYPPSGDDTPAYGQLHYISVSIPPGPHTLDAWVTDWGAHDGLVVSGAVEACIRTST